MRKILTPVLPNAELAATHIGLPRSLLCMPIKVMKNTAIAKPAATATMALGRSRQVAIVEPTIRQGTLTMMPAWMSMMVTQLLRSFWGTFPKVTLSMEPSIFFCSLM